jgi:carbon-monoxide dehydrogenase medium subunit
MVTHNYCVASKIIVGRGFPLAQAAWQVGAPQIRNRGTVAGNLITASPANDTITPLMALGAKVALASKKGERVVPLGEFYTGVRGTVMRADEILVDIFFPAMGKNQRGAFIKLGLRTTQAISLVNVATLLDFGGKAGDDPTDYPISRAAITLGAVAPTIVHADEAEAYLKGRTLDETTIARAAELAMKSARPIDDVRSPADYRAEMVRICTLRGLRAIRDREEKEGFPEAPVLLWGGKEYKPSSLDKPVEHLSDSPIVTRVNGVEHAIKGANHKTLLRLLREDVGLTGTKEGCAEGECGACTVFLDGAAVMSCLVPAPRAHRAEIITIEGLAQDGQLHPVQQTFIDEGAVQCGYCTPGFIMSAAKLLEERPHPTKEDVQVAISGNLCRCTGYYSIVRAIESAGQMEVSHG